MLNGQAIEQPLTFSRSETIDLELEQVSHAELGLLNALYRARPWSIRLGQQELLLKAEWSPERPHISDPWTVIVKLDEYTVELVAPQSILTRFLAELDARLDLSVLSDGLRALVLELALQQALEQFEESFQTPLSIQSVVKGDRTQMFQKPSAITLLIELPGNRASRCLLRLSPSVFGHFTAHDDRSSGHEKPTLNVSLPVNVRWGAVDLSIDELRGVKAGDIIMPDFACSAPKTGQLVIADQLVAKVECVPEGYRLISRPQAGEVANKWACGHPHTAKMANSDTTATAMTVRIFFELDHFNLDRNTAMAINRNDIVRVAEGTDGGVDLVVEGTAIGRGELTQIGDAMCVRVARL